MKRPSLAVAIGILGWSALAGCQRLPEPVCESTLLLGARTVRGPRTIALGQTASYALTYNTGTSCGRFDRFATNTIDSLGVSGRITRQVAVQARYSGCTCTTDTLTLVQTTYEFRPWRTGTYLLQFLTRRNQLVLVTDTLTVR